MTSSRLTYLEARESMGIEPPFHVVRTRWGLDLTIHRLVLKLESSCCGADLALAEEENFWACRTCQKLFHLPEHAQSFIFFKDFNASHVEEWLEFVVAEPLERVIMASETFHEVMVIRHRYLGAYDFSKIMRLEEDAKQGVNSPVIG